MAQRVKIELIDDLDNSAEATETVTFGLDGVTYEIDLNDANAAALRDALAVYVGAGRRVAGSRRGRRSAAPASGPSSSDVRDWARGQGYEVSDRGRIPAEIRKAYDDAH